VLATPTQINSKIQVISKQTKQEIQQFNPQLDNQTIQKFQSFIDIKSQIKIEPDLASREKEIVDKQLKLEFIPNPFVRQSVEVTQPVFINQIRNTQKILSNSQVELSTKDPFVIFHIMNAVAKQNNIEFILSDFDEKLKTNDLIEKSVDFSLQNQVITEKSLFLLGSEDIQHHIKGFSLHLNGDPSDIPQNIELKRQYINEVKTKFARALNIQPSSVIINSVTYGTCNYNITVRDLTLDAVLNLENNLRNEFRLFQRLEIHPSFLFLHFNSSNFDQRWNRDFTDIKNCPRGQKRGGLYDYHAPDGFFRYGLKVSGMYDNGNDTWLGCSNVPGEWAVAYHGTSYLSLKSILTNGFRSGSENHFGKGIYCTPYIKTAQNYCKARYEINTIHGMKRIKFVMMCRVNVSRVHLCTQRPCPESNNLNYTIHQPTGTTVEWFMNPNNQNGNFIRPYGILIKEI
jgi:hypothetical protein